MNYRARDSRLRRVSSILESLIKENDEESCDVTIRYKQYEGSNGGWKDNNPVLPDEVEVTIPFGGTYQCFDGILQDEEEAEEMRMEENGEGGEKEGVFDLKGFVEKSYIPCVNSILARFSKSLQIKRLTEIWFPQEFNFYNTTLYGTISTEAAEQLQRVWKTEDVSAALFSCFAKYADADDGGDDIAWHLIFNRAEEKYPASEFITYGTEEEDEESPYDSPEEVLLKAVQAGDKQSVVWAVDEEGVDPDTADAKGRTAMALAALNGHLDIVNFLYLRGADVQCDPSGNGSSPMEMALYGGDRLTIEFLRHICNRDGVSEGQVSGRANTITRGQMKEVEKDKRVYGIRTMGTCTAGPHLTVDGKPTIFFIISVNTDGDQKQLAKLLRDKGVNIDLGAMKCLTDPSLLGKAIKEGIHQPCYYRHDKGDTGTEQGILMALLIK